MIDEHLLLQRRKAELMAQLVGLKRIHYILLILQAKRRREFWSELGFYYMLALTLSLAVYAVWGIAKWWFR